MFMWFYVNQIPLQYNPIYIAVGSFDELVFLQNSRFLKETAVKNTNLTMKPIFSPAHLHEDF